MWELKAINEPAVRNKRALKRACVRRWNRAKLGNPSPILAIMTPNCLKVERAIIFLRSHSTMAAAPAISMVVHAVIRRNLLNKGSKDRNG